MSEHIEAVQVEWDDYPDRVYLRGHWPADCPRAEEALEAARAEFVEQAELHGLTDDLPEGKEWPCPPLGIGRLLWARWVPCQGGGWDMNLKTQTHPGRGAFPVTEVLDLAEQARQQAAREERERRTAEVRAALRARYPEITGLRVFGPTDDLRAAFWVPELQGDVWWREQEPDVVRVQVWDMLTWERLYAGRASARPPGEEG